LFNVLFNTPAVQATHSSPTHVTPASNGSSKRLKRITAIDLGTNSFHAIIADLFDDGHYEIVDALKEMVIMAELGVGKDLTPGAMDRGVAALRKFYNLSEGRQSEAIIAYATSAVREATNGGEFIQRVIDDVGIKINAISGLMEAELIAYGVQHGVAIGSTPVLMADIGGGSVEFIVGTQDTTSYLTSKKIGVARLASMFLEHDPITPAEVESIQRYIEKSLDPMQQQIGRLPSGLMIGSSGTYQTIAAMIDARRPNGHGGIIANEFEFSWSEFKSLFDEFLFLPKKKRLKVAGLEEKRSELILPGMILVHSIMRMFNVERVKISTQALREGILIRYIQKMYPKLATSPVTEDPRRDSVMELAIKCNWHESHSVQVCNLALELFDALQEVLKLDDTERELLEYAAILHDIGYHISHRKHHIHALYLIMNADLRGFSEAEIQIMAHVARYHRRSTPKKRHELYAELDKNLKKRIQKLAAILRVADGLDRSHYQNVVDMDVEVTKNDINISVQTTSDPELELWGAKRKSYLLEKVTKRSVVIEAQPETA
jgi:exopolyphosphatase/guanosine-5'-triphosphate,3'-diphosphate pyrophosphatase